MGAYLDHDGSLVVVLPDLRDLDQDRPWRSPPCQRCGAVAADWRVIAEPPKLDEPLCTPCAQQVFDQRLSRPGQVGAVPISQDAGDAGHQLDWSPR